MEGEQFIELGHDSRGKSWGLGISRTPPLGPRPARFQGDNPVEIPTEPRVGEPRIWACDAKDRLWVFAENGAGWSYTISTGKLQHFRIPVPQQVTASLTVQGDTLWFQEGDRHRGGEARHGTRPASV